MMLLMYSSQWPLCQVAELTVGGNAGVEIHFQLQPWTVTAIGRRSHLGIVMAQLKRPGVVGAGEGLVAALRKA